MHLILDSRGVETLEQEHGVKMALRGSKVLQMLKRSEVRGRVSPSMMDDASARTARTETVLPTEPHPLAAPQSAVRCALSGAHNCFI